MEIWAKSVKTFANIHLIWSSTLEGNRRKGQVFTFFHKKRLCWFGNGKYDYMFLLLCSFTFKVFTTSLQTENNDLMSFLLTL